MLKNYLLVTLRSLRRDYGFALINVCGLTIGIACFLILALHLESELTYDQHYQGHEHLYRVVNELDTNGKVDLAAVTSRELAPLLAKDYPQVLDYVRFARSSNSGRLLLRNDETAFYWDGVWMADQNVFEMFSHDIIYGDPATALIDPLAIAISESMSKKYFGDRNPIGETLATDTAGYKEAGGN